MIALAAFAVWRCVVWRVEIIARIAFFVAALAFTKSSLVTATAPWYRV
jgi:hypothetical protein